MDKKTLRKFGITMAVAFLFISSLFFFRQKYNVAVNSLVISCLFMVIGLAFPVLLKPVYIAWMRFAFVLGWINTKIILVVLFYLVFAPTGLLMRLCGVDLLERKNKPASYWKKKEQEESGISSYERRF